MSDADDIFDDEVPEEMARELAEAAALAQALEGGAALPELPDDALQMAASLIHCAGHDALQPDQHARGLAELLQNAEGLEAKHRRRESEAKKQGVGYRFKRWWWVAGASLGLSTAAILLLLVRPVNVVSDRTETSLPRPSAALLGAQLSRASGDVGDAEAMEAYRNQVYGALRERYGALQ